jgi:hypothetical protein
MTSATPVSSSPRRGTWMNTLRIDPEISIHQEEWAELYSQTMKSLIETDSGLQYSDENFQMKEYLNSTLGWLSYEERKKLQNIWFKQAISGKPIFYPSDDTDLFLYWIYESMAYNMIVDLSIVTMIVLSLIQSKQCFSWSYSATDNDLSINTSAFIFIFTLFQLFDIFLFTRLSHWKPNHESSTFSSYLKISNYIQQDSTISWQILRFFSLFIFALNCMIRFKYPTLPFFSQVFIPFLIIPRREDLKQLAKGILTTIVELKNIFQIWLLFLVLWAFVGFCLLRRFNDTSDGDDDIVYSGGHFITYWKSLYVCFHCILSRPTTLYRLKPIFSQNNFIAFYFVFLTIFGDILISALVIAIGTRAFRVFSRQNLNGRLVYRHDAILAIYNLYSDPTNNDMNQFEMEYSEKLATANNINSNNKNNNKNKEEAKERQDEEDDESRKQQNKKEETRQSTSAANSSTSAVSGMSFVQWYNFCMELPRDLSFHNENDIHLLFLTEDPQNTGRIREIQFIRLCSIISRKLIFFTSTLHNHAANIDPFHVNTLEQTRRISMKNKNVMKRLSQQQQQSQRSSVTPGNGASGIDAFIDHNNVNVNPLVSANEDMNTLSFSKASTVDNNRSTTNNASSSSFSSSLPSESLGSVPSSPSSTSSSFYRTSSRSTFYDVFAYRDSLSNFIHKHTGFGLVYDWIRKKIFRFYYFHLIINNPFYSSSASSTATPAAATTATAATPSTTAASSSSRTTSSLFPFSFFPSSSSFLSLRSLKVFRIHVFIVFEILLIVVLVIQTTALSSSHRTVGAIVLGWFLLFAYFFEVILLTIVLKRSKFELKILWFMNILQFFLYCFLGHNVNHLNQTVLTLIIILQSIRFVQCLTNFLIFRSFVKIFPVLSRAIVFYAMFLYSFAWIGHMTLCNLMNSNDLSQEDDDSHGWIAFSNLLNFNTIFSSYYTVAESGILSNWSMVMDAALNSNHGEVTNWIYFYFFSLRFFTVLILLPLLMSCVIQTYMQYFTKYSSPTLPTPATTVKKDDNHQQPVIGNKRASTNSTSIVDDRFNDKLSLDYYHITMKFKETDEIAALWSPDGKAKVSLLKTVYTGKYGISLEDLFNQEVIDSLDHQITATKQLLLTYYTSNIRSFKKNQEISQVLQQIKALNTASASLLKKHTSVDKEDHDSDNEEIDLDEKEKEEEIQAGNNSSPIGATTRLRSKSVSSFHSNIYNNRYVKLFQLTDAMIIRKQIKWMKDYHDFEKRSYSTSSLSSSSSSNAASRYRYIDSSLLAICKERLKDEEKGHLAAIWFNDGINGFPLIYPFSGFSLSCLSILHSVSMTNVLYCLAILQMFAVFLIIPACLASGSPAPSSGEGLISTSTLAIFDLCCVLTYYFEIFLDYQACWNTYQTYHVFPSRKSWLFQRTFFVTSIFLKSIISLTNASTFFNNLRIVRCFFPILVISRNSNYHDIFYGIALSMKETKKVYFLFSFFILIFSFSGFWLFQRFSTHASRFISFLHSLLVILQCSIAAPYSLNVLSPYFEISQLSPLFWFILSYGTEILVINLIIGTGNVFFARYGESILQTRKEKQFNSFMAIFLLLSSEKEKVEVREEEEEKKAQTKEKEGEEEQFITFNQFLYFCRYLSKKFFKVSFSENPLLFEEILFSLLLYIKKDVLLMNSLIEEGGKSSQQQAKKKKEKKEPASTPKNDGENQAIEPDEEEKASPHPHEERYLSEEEKRKNIYKKWKINKEEFIQLLFMIFNGITGDFVNNYSASSSDENNNNNNLGIHSDSFHINPMFDQNLTEMKKKQQAEQAATSLRKKEKENNDIFTKRNPSHDYESNSRIALDPHKSWKKKQEEKQREQGILSKKKKQEEEEDAKIDDSNNGAIELSSIQHYHHSHHHDPVEIDTKKGKMIGMDHGDSDDEEKTENQREKKEKKEKEVENDHTVNNKKAEAAAVIDSSSSISLHINDIHNLLKNEIPISICEISIKNEESSSFKLEDFQSFFGVSKLFTRNGYSSSFSSSFLSIHREYLIAIINVCQFLSFQQIILFSSQPISLLDCFSFVCHFLLLIQLCYFASITLSSFSWLLLGYFLEFCFWMEMIIRMIANGEKRYFSDSMHVCRFLINFFSFFFMIFMGNNYNNSTTNGSYLMVILLQCLRLILFCTRIRGNGRYRLAIKNTCTALFLFLLILYFWTIIAQEIFCGVLQDNTITGSVTNDDDASNWNQFSHILNFNNYQQSLFTLFEVSVLGS